MTYRVVYADSFTEDLDKQVAFLLDRGVAVRVIERWFAALFKQVDDLSIFPERYPTDNVQTAIRGRETRKMNFRDYLVFYEVDNERKRVEVLYFMRGSIRRDV